MMVYRAITAMETLCWALYFSSIFLVGQYEAFVTIPASLVSTIYPPELGGSPPHLSSAAVSHSQCRTSLSLLPSQGRSSESIHEQQLCSLREALLKKKAEVEKEKKVLEELKQMEMDKSENNSLLPGSESTIERRQGNSSFLEGLSKHVLQGDNGAMCLKALAFRNGMNMTEANTYILQIKHVLHLLEVAESIPGLRGGMGGGGCSWLSDENPLAITTSCQSFLKLENMWMEAMHDGDSRLMVLTEELWDMLTTEAYDKLLDYGLGLGIPYQGGVTLARWAEKSLSNTQEGDVMWTDDSTEIKKNIFIKAAAYVLGGLSICTCLNFKPALNTLTSSEGYDFLNFGSPSSDAPYLDIFNPSDNELLLKQQFGIRSTARLKFGLGFNGMGDDNMPDTFTHPAASGVCTSLNISERKCPRETMLGLLAVETACLAYGANALLNETNESWLEGKNAETIAIEALEACMMRPTVCNVLCRLGLTPEMENELLRGVSPCSPGDVRLFRRNILRDDVFEPSPKAVPFNERSSADRPYTDVHEIGYSELSPGTCSTGDMIPCHGIVAFKGKWKLTPDEVNIKLRKRLEDDSTGLSERVEALFWSDEFSHASGFPGARASTIRGWISWAIAELEKALLKDATSAIEMRGDLSDALDSIGTAMRSRIYSRYTIALLPKPLKLQGPSKIPSGLAIGTAAVTLGAFSLGMQSCPAEYAPIVLTVMASVQAVHEFGHILVAKQNGFDKAVPTILPIPSPTLGISGTALWPQCMMSSQDSAFEMYMAGPIAGLSAACVAFVAGLFLGGGGSEGAVGLPVEIVQDSWLVSKFLDFIQPGFNIFTDMASNPLPLHPLAAGGIAALYTQALQGLCVVGSDISTARKMLNRSMEPGDNFKQNLAFNFMSSSLPLIGNCAILYAALLKHDWVPLSYVIALWTIFQNDEWRRSRCLSDVGLTHIPTK